MEKNPNKNVLFNHQAWAEARPKTISRRAFAKEIGTSDSNLIMIEKGESMPSFGLALRYCAATRLPLQSLICLKN
jgi:DNA-binding XRE family transcriptional regulator